MSKRASNDPQEQQARRLVAADASALRTLLLEAQVANLGLLGRLAQESLATTKWFGSWEQGRLTSALRYSKQGLSCLSTGAPDCAEGLSTGLRALGLKLAGLSGPRAACDRLWKAASEEGRGISSSKSLAIEQCLFVLDSTRLKVKEQSAGLPGDLAARPDRRAQRNTGTTLRLAQPRDLETLVRWRRLAWEEEYGSPSPGQPMLDALAVSAQVRIGRVWVLEAGDHLCFQAKVDAHCEQGAQLAGIYVPPNRRGQGLASAAVAELCRRLLREFPRLTLQVAENNAPAIAVYRACGFQPHAAWRLWLA